MLPTLPGILLVDDDETALYLHQRLVNALGLTSQVLTATDGEQALQLLQQASSPPALILLDLNMPVLNGFEFLARYAHLPPPTPRPVVVLLSSSDQALAQARVQQLPADDYLTKPLTREKLLAVVQQHFTT